MGLDVYLYRCADRKAANAEDEQYQAQCNAIWEEVGQGRGYDALTDDEKDEARERITALKTEQGRGQYGENPRIEKIERDSSKYPEHLFKIGYLRSSYNGGGFDAVMRRAGLTGLYDIFGVVHDDYEVVPDWEASRKRAQAALDAYRLYVASPQGKYDVTVFSANQFIDPRKLPQDEREARAIFTGQLDSLLKNPDRSYGNGEGDFFGTPMKIAAMIPGFQYGRPCQYAVYERDPADLEWYGQALEIVLEGIDYVLAQADRQAYYMHWSG